MSAVTVRAYVDNHEPPPDGLTLLKSAEDFKWYKLQIDVGARHEHEHRNEPTEYPCAVLTQREWNEHNDYPPYVNACDHLFLYRQRHQCEACGAIERVSWPDVPAELTEAIE